MNLRDEFRFIKALKSPRVSRLEWSLGPCFANDSLIYFAVVLGTLARTEGEHWGDFHPLKTAC